MAPKTKKMLMSADSAAGAKGMRAVAYIRTAPDQITTVPASTLQRQLLESWCEEHEVRFTEYFEDHCLDDAPLSKRTGLAKALNALAENKCQILLILSQDRVAHDDFDGVVVETIATERYGAQVLTLDGPCDWGDVGEEARIAIARYIETARAIDDAMQNDDNVDDWAHIQTVANLAVPRPNPENSGRVERPSLNAISDMLQARGMVSRKGTAYAPIQVSRMLEKWEAHQLVMKDKEKAHAQSLLAAKA
mgnify:CR=1 FL=1